MKNSVFLYLLVLLGVLVNACQKQTSNPAVKQQLGIYRDSLKFYMYTDLDRAQHFTNLASDLADSTGIDSLIFPALINQGLVSMFKADYNRTHLFLDSVLSHPRVNDYPKQLLRALGHKGNVYHYEKKFEASEAIFRKALALPRKDGDMAANTWLNFGAMLMTKKDFEGAITAFQSADSLMDAGFGDDDDRFTLLANQAGANINLNNFERAAQIYKKAITFGQKINRNESAAFLYNSMAHAYIKADSLNLVPALLDSAKLHNNGDKVEMAVTYTRTSDFYCASGDYKTALNYCQQSFDLLNREQDKYYLVYCVSQLLFIKNKLGNPAGTPELIETVYRDCPTCLSAADSIEFEGYALLNHIWQTQGSPGNYDKLRAHLSHIDGYHRQQQQEVIHEQELKYQTAKKEKENAVLLLQTETQNLQLLGLSLGLLILVVASLGLYYRNRQKAAQLLIFDLRKQQLELENQELSDALRALQNREISTGQVLQKNITLSGGTILSLQNILYLESSGDAVYFHTAQGRHFDSRLLKHWEEKLEQTGAFLRIHKQYIINLSLISARPAYNALEVGGTNRLPVGRTYLERVAEAIPQ